MNKNYYKPSKNKHKNELVFLGRELQNILIEHWLFGTLPGERIVNLTYQFSSREYKTGQYVFHQDDKADQLFVIIEGEVSIETVNIDGKVTILTHLHKGDVFGEFGLLDSRLRSASAHIIRPTILAALSVQSFDDLIANNPDFAKKLMTGLVKRLRESNEQIESIVTKSLLQRTVQCLLQISSHQGPELLITQTGLADRLFATRERVNSKLKHLERLGAIKTGHGKILIKDVERLLSIVDG